jgi:hypothetical protein
MLDTTNQRGIIRHIPFGKFMDPFAVDRYDATLKCLEHQGSLDECYHLADVWLNISLPW